MNWTAADLDRAKKPPAAAQAPRKRPAPSPAPPAASEAGRSQLKQPQRVGQWEVRQAAGLDYCRLLVQGPPEEAERMRTHILAFKP